MPAQLANLLDYIVAAAGNGRTLTSIKTTFVGAAKAKTKSPAPSEDRAAELSRTLSAYVQAGKIRGPFAKNKTQQLYFAAGFGPTLEKVSQAISEAARQSGVKLLKRTQLATRTKGLDKPYFADAIADAVARRAIMEVTIGASKFYLHRETAAERLGFEEHDRPSTGPEPTFGDMLPAYRRLKSEQGGFSTVKIFDLIRVMNASAASVHRLLIDEAKAGRVTIHPTTSVDLPPEVIAAGIRLPGFSETFITVVVKEAP